MIDNSVNNTRRKRSDEQHNLVVPGDVAEFVEFSVEANTFKLFMEFQICKTKFPGYSIVFFLF